MANISTLVAAAIFFAGYLTRNNGGVPLPIKERCTHDDICWKRLDLWSWLVGDGQPPTFSNLLIKNMSVWFFVYTIAHILTHVEPQRRLFKPFKFNPNYPPTSLVAMEFLRSARAILITTTYEFLVSDQHARKNLPLVELPDMFQISDPTNETMKREISLIGFFITSIFNYLWGDFHFYWSHRMLHTKWLYKTVHKVHHESYNPDPFSGKNLSSLYNNILGCCRLFLSFFKFSLFV